MINIFNTMTLKKEPFEPIEPMKVSMYVCGPTVYDYIHIGNARSAIAFDTIRRYFIYRGYEVKYVSNFTDVDDKMIQVAEEQKISVTELANRYINAYEKDAEALNIMPATISPRATDNISDIINFIQKLIDKDYAYVVDGDVYFRVRKYKEYGILIHQNFNELKYNAAGRLNDDEVNRKEDPMDFAVWKSSKNSKSISWESPWGVGRPGWHIECSVMSTKYLGDSFDIHGGGIDLVFPHHTNEIAQAEAKTGKHFVNKWLHNGFVTVGNDEKMSKSMNNFVTVHELLSKLDDPMILRFMMSTTQYRRPILYSKNNLDLAERNLQRIKTAYQNLSFCLKNSKDGHDYSIEKQVKIIIGHFIDAMDDDFNVQNGISSVFELVELANVYSSYVNVKSKTINFILKTISELMMIFGIDNLTKNKKIDQVVDKLIQEREIARQNSNYKKADRIRDELLKQGIILEDTIQGVRWRQK